MITVCVSTLPVETRLGRGTSQTSRRAPTSKQSPVRNTVAENPKPMTKVVSKPPPNANEGADVDGHLNPLADTIPFGGKR
jgi:hypothetical protein